MPLGTEVDFDPSDIVLMGIDGDPAPPPKNWAEPPSPEFSANVYCAQTAGWVKMPLGMEVGLDSSDTVLDGDPAPLPKKGQSPHFWPMSIVAKRLHGSR